MPEVPLDKLFVLLFMMTGPLRVVPGFAGLTRNVEPSSVRNRLALRGTLFAAAGIFLAIFVGHTVLKSWGASPAALATATGLLLLITALQSLVGWPASSLPTTSEHTPPEKFALSPLAFPTILPPFAVGVLILFGAHFPDLTSQAKMLALAYGLLAVDFLAMCYARQIMATIGATTLQVLGAVFGVLQLSLAVQMIFWALQTSFPPA